MGLKLKGAMSSIIYSISVFPEILCKTFGKDDFILVPRPAASIIHAVFFTLVIFLFPYCLLGACSWHSPTRAHRQACAPYALRVDSSSLPVRRRFFSGYNSPIRRIVSRRFRIKFASANLVAGLGLGALRSAPGRPAAPLTLSLANHRCMRFSSHLLGAELPSSPSGHVGCRTRTRT